MRPEVGQEKRNCDRCGAHAEADQHPFGICQQYDCSDGCGPGQGGQFTSHAQSRRNTEAEPSIPRG